MFKDYKSNYCPQARMSNYVKLWLKTAQLSVSSLGGWRCSSAHVAGLGLGWAATAGAGTSPRPLGSHSSFRETQGMSTGPRESRRNRGKGENQEGNGTKGLGGSRLHPPSPQPWARSGLPPAGRSWLLLWGKGTTTPPGPLPALVFSVFLWEPFTSSKREVCVYFSSLPFDSSSPLFFCQRVRNKFRFKRQPEMCVQAQSCFIFITL